MIEMIISEKGYDTRLTATDWRFGAAAVGLIRYFKYHRISHETVGDTVVYCRDDVLWETSREKYLDFAAHYFDERMHHNKLRFLLQSKELSEDAIKEANSLMSANTVMKKVFAKKKYSEEEAGALLDLLDENRLEIIQETYRYGKSTYQNFCNTFSLGEKGQEVCRIVGYNIDLGKKKKSVAFNWDYSTYVYTDVPEFDYIPFAFTKTWDAFFINNNFSLDQLVKSNDALLHRLQETGESNPRSGLFLSSANAASFINYDVEVIVKSRDADYFETLFVRDEAIKVFKEISNDDQKKDSQIIKAISLPCKVGKDSYLNMVDIVVDAIVNQKHLDPVLDRLLKDRKENYHGYLISQLIRVNAMIYKGGDKMNKSIFHAMKAGQRVVKELSKQPNKVESYRNRLISCLTFKDYDRFSTVLLRLSAYSGVTFDFAYDLFEDFESNKNLAYAFVNALQVREQSKEEKNEK